MMTGQLTTYSTSVQELTIAEKERHVDNVTPILKAMALTPYACSELEQLSGGLVNLTYRGSSLNHFLMGVAASLSSLRKIIR